MKQGKETGDVDAWLLLTLVVSMQLLSWQLLQATAEALGTAYAALETAVRTPLLEKEDEFSALNQAWPSPAPRSDFGAHYERKKDAEALCFIVRCCLSEAESELYQCDGGG